METNMVTLPESNYGFPLHVGDRVQRFGWLYGGMRWLSEVREVRELRLTEDGEGLRWSVLLDGLRRPCDPDDLRHAEEE